MRLEGISSIGEPNSYLSSYQTTHNARFARPAANSRDLHRPLAPRDDLHSVMVWREQRTVTAALTLHYNKVLFLLEPPPLSKELARKRVDVCEYPDGTVEMMPRINQPAVVDNKHLDAALALARTIQQAQPHHAKRNNNEPARTAQPAGVFKAPSSAPSGQKLDRRTLGNSRLKCGPSLSNEELVARGLGKCAR